MVNHLNPYEQFSLYPRDDYGDFGGLLSRELPSARDRAEERARREHPSAQPFDPSEERSEDLRVRLAS